MLPANLTLILFAATAAFGQSADAPAPAFGLASVKVCGAAFQAATPASFEECRYPKPGIRFHVQEEPCILKVR